MNVTRTIDRINQAELRMGLHGAGTSWHDDFRQSAYIFVGNLDFSLTEGDILTVFSQFGEIIDIDLKRDADTGKSRGFCFLAYEDQRSTDLAVDNFNGTKLCGRTIRVDHTNNYFKKEVVKKGSDSDDEGDAAQKPPKMTAMQKLLLAQLRGEAPIDATVDQFEDDADDVAKVEDKKKAPSAPVVAKEAPRIERLATPPPARTQSTSAASSSRKRSRSRSPVDYQSRRRDYSPDDRRDRDRERSREHKRRRERSPSPRGYDERDERRSRRQRSRSRSISPVSRDYRDRDRERRYSTSRHEERAARSPSPSPPSRRDHAYHHRSTRHDRR